jgi:hypothetical protein
VDSLVVFSLNVPRNILWQKLSVSRNANTDALINFVFIIIADNTHVDGF